MVFSVILLIATMALWIILIRNTQKRLLSFEATKQYMSDLYNDPKSFVPPDQEAMWRTGSQIFTYIMYGLYVIYYLASAFYISFAWFWVISLVQIILTIGDGKLASTRIIYRDDTDKWEKSFRDNVIYKLIVCVILEHLYYVFVLLSIFTNIINRGV